MGRYKKIILEIKNDTIDDATLKDFFAEISSKFKRYLNLENIDTDAEIMLSCIHDAFLKNLSTFAQQVESQSEEEVDKWFSVWLNKTIHNYAKKYIRLCKIRSKLLSEPDVMIDKDNNNDQYIELSSSEIDDVLSQIIDDEFMNKFFSMLTEEERKVAVSLLGNYKQKEIAQQINKSEPTVSRIVNSIREKLKKLLKEYKS